MMSHCHIHSQVLASRQCYIVKHWLVDDVTLSYPFFHPPRFEILEDGWQAYSVESEFNRILSRSAADWRISHVNSKFEVHISTVLYTLRFYSTTVYVQSMPVCPSVSLSHWWISQKRLKLGSCNFTTE